MPKGNRSNDPGGFLSNIVAGGVMAETPDGVINGTMNLGPHAKGPSPPQEHEGAMNEPTMTGNRGGRSGNKPVESAGE